MCECKSSVFDSEIVYCELRAMSVASLQKLGMLLQLACRLRFYVKVYG